MKMTKNAVKNENTTKCGSSLRFEPRTDKEMEIPKMISGT